MRFALFVHSLRSDWNHGNAHFLRGVASELVARGHEVVAHEHAAAWSAVNLARDEGASALEAWRAAYPELTAHVHEDPATLDLEHALRGVDVALVHEWSPPALVARLGEARRRRPSLRLLFHDTHHRAITAPAELAGLELTGYDAVLAFGRVLRDRWLAAGWIRNAFTWHEAADLRRFAPRPSGKGGDLAFIGNWGDGERSAELREFLLEPARAARASGTVHGVRYPDEGRRAVAAAGLAHGGYLPNFRAPEVLARHRVTIHVPRRPYAEALPGIPTIRVFEALACGIPLLSAPWQDAEDSFRPGVDFLIARDGAEMTRHLRAVLDEPALARSLAASGLETVRARHTCAHRVDELFEILRCL
ncbi:MAG: glycosyltransferase [Anaeromyxobacteraceae bacterium]